MHPSSDPVAPYSTHAILTLLSQCRSPLLELLHEVNETGEDIDFSHRWMMAMSQYERMIPRHSEKQWPRPEHHRAIVMIMDIYALLLDSLKVRIMGREAHEEASCHNRRLDLLRYHLAAINLLVAGKHWVFNPGEWFGIDHRGCSPGFRTEEDLDHYYHHLEADCYYKILVDGEFL